MTRIAHSIPQRGFSLLEVMIALLVLSVGLLGLVGMQIKSLQANQIAFGRTQAVQLAYDMADRIRANSIPGASDPVNAATIATYVIGHSAPAPVAKNCSNEACSRAEMATFDQAAWKNSITAILPGGGGEITSPAANTVNITVRWDQERSGATGTTCPPAAATDLRCYRITVNL